MSEFKYNNKEVFYDEKNIYSSKFPIQKIIQFNNIVVILFDRDYYKDDNENVIAINNIGERVWKVPKYNYIDKRSPYIEISKHIQNSKNAKLYNWDSSYIIIEVETGKVKVDPYQSAEGRRPW